MTLLKSEPMPECETAARTQPITTGEPLGSRDFSDLRRRMILDHCKWDPQVGDVSTIADFPLLMPRETLRQLSALAEQLTVELFAAEEELICRPDLHARLSIPRRVRAALKAALKKGETPALVRVMRFDFHWTDQGWRISEVNSDVPGGFSEASALPRLMAEYTELIAPADPTAEWVRQVATQSEGDEIALMVAPGFMEDMQVVAYLASQLRRSGLRPYIVRPQQICWRSGRAYIERSRPVGGIVRFFQAEWLARLPGSCRWRPLLMGGCTPVSNPARGIFGESKRFALVWDQLHAHLKTWRRLLPATCEPRQANWRRDDRWVLKTAFCNTGDTVVMREHLTPRVWRRVSADVWLRPSQWVAQERFRTLPISTPRGDMYPCLGLYTINGRAAGVYSRLGHKPLIDYQALDAALLITPGSSTS